MDTGAAEVQDLGHMRPLKKAMKELERWDHSLSRVQEDKSSIPKTDHVWFRTACNSSCWESNFLPLSGTWLHGHIDTHN